MAVYNIIKEWERVIENVYSGIKDISVGIYLDENDRERIRFSTTYTNYLRDTRITHTFTVKSHVVPDPFVEYLLEDIVDDEIKLLDKSVELPTKRFKTIFTQPSKLNMNEYIYTHIVPEMVMINSNLPSERFESLKHKMYILQEELR